MRITLTDAGKRFNREWIFRHLSYEFTSGQAYAITGPNGSGKSTLLQVIAGAIQHNEGKISYQTALESSVYNSQLEGQAASDADVAPMLDIEPEKWYKYIAIAAPYLELVEEMTLLEFLHFHKVFKPFLPYCTIGQMIDRVGLSQAGHKQIRYFSSGMKQRVKLLQAIFSDAPAILLDEPCTNLDVQGVTLYQDLIAEYLRDRLLIISSNDQQEYACCSQILNIANYK